MLSSSDAIAHQGKVTLSRWQAMLLLVFSARKNEATTKTRLARCRHKGPLYVQKPFYPEGPDLCHVYILHPPGGIVSGDHLHIGVDVEENAKALVTTPGAGRIYRARQDRLLQQQSVDVHIAAQASLEWMPLETIVFNDANVKLKTRVHLEDNAIFIGWDVTCLGLLASGEAFEQGSLQQSFEIYRNNKAVYIERLFLDEKNIMPLQRSPIGFNAKTVSGMMVFCSEAILEAHVSAVSETLAALEDGALVQLTLASADCLVMRYLGDSAEQARRIFVQLWSVLRPYLINRAACPARIWST